MNNEEILALIDPATVYLRIEVAFGLALGLKSSKTF